MGNVVETLGSICLLIKMVVLHSLLGEGQKKAILMRSHRFLPGKW